MNLHSLLIKGERRMEKRRMEISFFRFPFSFSPFYITLIFFAEILNSPLSAINCNQKYYPERNIIVTGSQNDTVDFRTDFLLLCDSASRIINDQKTSLDFFIESYAVRALCVAYDLTGKQQYLDACITWSNRMVEYQNKMIPAGAYYMNYERKPGEEKGDWFVADGSTIAMGILATSVHCKGTEKNMLEKSVKNFATLVIKNYLGPSGGVCNGGWSQSKAEWWCSSGLFGSLTFLLYDKTRDKKYLNTALNIIDWLNKQDLTKATPFPLSEQGPSMPMYFLEAYTAGFPYIEKKSELKKAAIQKVNWCLKWISEQQSISIKDRKWAPTEWWGSKFGGLPFHQYVFAKYLIGSETLKNNGDQELRMLSDIVKSNKLYGTQLTMFMLLSYAERLSPGGVYQK